MRGYLWLISKWRGSALNPLPLLQSASLATALIARTDDRFVVGSDRFCAMVGYCANELPKRTAAELHLWAVLDRDTVLQRLDQQGVVQQECQLRHRAGHLIDLELSIEAVQLHRQPHLLLVGVDIRQRKQVEVKLEACLQERKVLLKEVHHRVRNNLHLISNLLDLQASTLPAALHNELTEQFATAQNRIQTMALIYEQLYQSDDLGRVDFGEYLKRLMLNVFLANSPELGLIEPKIRVESVYLNLETAVPCALLINELLVNSLRHAFPNGQSGEIRVALHQVDQQIHITVQDNGIGIAPEFDWRNPSSLGFRLIGILAKQLKAEIDLDRTAGTAMHLSFSELQYKPRL